MPDLENKPDKFIIKKKNNIEVLSYTEPNWNGKSQ